MSCFFHIAKIQRPIYRKYTISVYGSSIFLYIYFVPEQGALTGQMTDYLTGALTGQMADYLTGVLTRQSADCLTD